MNAHARPQSREALPEAEPLEEFVARPLSVTADVYEDMARRGAFAQVGATELRQGVICQTMSPLHRPHASTTYELAKLLEAAAKIDVDLRVLPEVSIRFGDAFYPKADVVVWRASKAPDEEGAVPGDACVLVVEVAVSTLQDDLGPKLIEYAQNGTPEYWVVDVKGGVIHRCAEPTNNGYARREPTPFGEPARSLTLPLVVETAALKR
jgi:Uma2 family endonuclease